MPEADPGIAVTRRHGGWITTSENLPDSWGIKTDDPACCHEAECPTSKDVELDIEAADAELKRLGYRRTGDWIDSGGQWAANVGPLSASQTA